MNEETIETIPYEHSINLVESDEVIEVEPKRTMVIVRAIKIEAGGKIKIPVGAKLAFIGGY